MHTARQNGKKGAHEFPKRTYTVLATAQDIVFRTGIGTPSVTAWVWLFWVLSSLGARATTSAIAPSAPL